MASFKAFVSIPEAEAGNLAFTVMDTGSVPMQSIRKSAGGQTE